MHYSWCEVPFDKLAVGLQKVLKQKGLIKESKNNLNEAEQSILKKNIVKIEKPEKIKEPEKIDKIEKIEKIAKIEKIKKEDTDYDFGCLMVNVPIKNWDDVLALIDPEDVYDEPGYGLESEPHITVLYGFHDEVKAIDWSLH